MNPAVLALGSVLLSVAAQFALKAGMRGAGGASLFTAVLHPMVVLGLALYGLSAIVWLSVLARWDVSKAYPLVGLGFALTVVIACVAGEQIPVTRWAGAALICAGVVLVGRS